ncbi:hypothetical protein PISL3812_06374 [Talaromyces islandicus]|uniref:Uncharacterized protein n=1 Tax=Talaromyces islandicus TaxID=28573 RepID=A0A0U1M1C2_TALIS|nr:hypothetical protein PISL3812_06374 [Talaromyces islandicus]
MDSPSLKPNSPSKTPLYPASPDRINQQKLVGSPSLPSDLHPKSSDVQAKIAFINGLSRSGSPAPNSQHSSSTSVSAALQRAILGREEAESALARADAQLSEAQSRERRISERLESLLEELQTTRERQAHERTLFEKEVRKARKEAFRAGSTLVKVQEELKLSKSEARTLKDDIRTEREAKENAKQEAFERAYALAGITEELQSLKDQLRAKEAANQSSVQLEMDAIDENKDKPQVDYADQATCTTPMSRRTKRSADASELLTTASQSIHEEETPTKKIRLSRRVSNKENGDPEEVQRQADIIEDLKAEIKFEQRQREKADEMIHFMKMECQFKRCSCRIAESQGFDYVHDKEWHKKSQESSASQRRDEQQIHNRDETPAISPHSPFESPATAMTPPTPEYREPDVPTDIEPTEESEIAFCPTTGTFVSVPSPHAEMTDRPSEGPLVLPNVDDISSPRFENPAVPTIEHDDLRPDIAPGPYEVESVDADVPVDQPVEHAAVDQIDPIQDDDICVADNQPSEPLPITPTEQFTNMQEESITRTVPLQTEPRRSQNLSAVIPGTPVTREEALAQIRARRGRARSLVKRSASTGEATVRAPGQGATTTNRIPGMAHSDTRSEPDVGDRRDYSAPVRRRY